MNRTRNPLTLVAKSVTEHFVKEKYPNELDFFDTIWDIFVKLGRPLREGKAEQEKLGFLRRKTISALGFGEAETLDLVTPSVIALISAATYHLGTLEGEIEDEKIKDVINIYAETYGVKRELREEIITQVVPLLKLELFRLKPIRQKPAAGGALKIGIRDTRPYVEIDRQEITEFRDREATFVRLTLLVAARISKDEKYKGGYILRDELYDRRGHEVSRIRKLLGLTIEAKGDRSVRLKIKKAEIDDSIGGFQPKYLRALKEKADSINEICIPEITESATGQSIEELRTIWKRFMKLFLTVAKQTELVKRAMELTNKGQYDDTKFVALTEKARRLKERIRQILPGFFEDE